MRRFLRRLRAAWVRSAYAYEVTPPTLPRRDDAVAHWLKIQRDRFDERHDTEWDVLDSLLDLYRLHADTGTPLGEHICEGRVVGDCECFETGGTR